MPKRQHTGMRAVYLKAAELEERDWNVFAKAPDTEPLSLDWRARVQHVP